MKTKIMIVVAALALCLSAFGEGVPGYNEYRDNGNGAFVFHHFVLSNQGGYVITLDGYGIVVDYRDNSGIPGNPDYNGGCWNGWLFVPCRFAFDPISEPDPVRALAWVAEQKAILQQEYRLMILRSWIRHDVVQATRYVQGCAGQGLNGAANVATVGALLVRENPRMSSGFIHGLPSGHARDMALSWFGMDGRDMIEAWITIVRE